MSGGIFDPPTVVDCSNRNLSTSHINSCIVSKNIIINVVESCSHQLDWYIIRKYKTHQLLLPTQTSPSEVVCHSIYCKPLHHCRALI